MHKEIDAMSSRINGDGDPPSEGQPPTNQTSKLFEQQVNEKAEEKLKFFQQQFEEKLLRMEEAHDELRNLLDVKMKVQDERYSSMEGLVANKADVDKKFANVDEKIANKADVEELAKKADVEDVDEKLTKKADAEEFQEMKALIENQIGEEGQTVIHGILQRSILSRVASTLALNDKDGDCLDEDTFSLMMVSKIYSRSWVLGWVTFSFQVTLGLMIAIDQGVQSADSSVFDVPFKVSPFVTTGQILSIFLCLATQNDILIPIRNFVQLGGRSNWDEIIGESGNRSRNLWWIRIALPNIMKFLTGVLVTFISFVIIVQADNIIDLLKDFTALMVISEVDNILFQLASHGYLGDELCAATTNVRNAEVTTFESATQSGHSRIRNNGILFVRLVFFLLLLGMFGGWTWIYINQSRGEFFKAKFPGCQDHVDLALDKFGDGVCYGGPLNSLGCKFEDGDCSNFNEAYPLCKGDHLIDVENEVGNGTCSIRFANYECDFDGGDCCPYDIFKSSKFEDGLCNGGKISTKSCGFDGGDCNALLREYPDCPLDEIANIEGSSDIILGDGICEGAMYKSELCGREFRDCDVGQLGQDITLHGVASGTTVDLRVRMTGDGSKLMIGMPGTDLNDNWNATSAGQLRFFDYDNEGDIWAKSLPDLVGKNADDRFGFSMAMNHDGSQVVVGSHRYNGAFGKVNAYRFSTLQDRWVQLGQTLNGPPTGRWGGYTVDMTKDGSRVALSAPLYKLNDENVQAGKIQVFELDSSARAWNQIGQDINGGNRMLIGYFFLEFDLSGSRVYFSSGFSNKPAISVKVYEHNKQANEWVQLGGDIPNPYPRKTQRPPISADGSRIAVASNIAKGSEDPSQVQVFDLDMSKGNATWVQVGTTLTGSNEQDPDGFGYNVDFDSSGSLLAIASLNPNCLGSPEWCPTGSIKLYRYSPNNQPSRVFSEVPFKQIGDTDNVMQEAIREFDKNIFGGGMHLSNDGSKISVVGYDFVNNYGFVKVYNVDDLFFSECVVPDPSIVGNGNCADFEPYYTAECGYDGGDCGEPIKVDEFENCYVRTPNQLGNGVCVDDFPYNSEECGYDGGDCSEPVEVEGYPGCFVRNSEEIGNGRCVDQLPYGSPECGFDGGDCLNK